VQIDFTEARLSLKARSLGWAASSVLDLNNTVLSRFTVEERERIGVHSCPGGDQDSTAQRRRQLRRARAGPARARCGPLLPRARERARPARGARDDPHSPKGRSTGSSSASPTPSTQRSRRRSRCATAFSKQLSTFRSTSSERPMTAGLPPLPTTRRPRARPAFAKIRGSRRGHPARGRRSSGRRIGKTDHSCGRCRLKDRRQMPAQRR